ncbi:MAG: hypothetical protein EOP38_06295 [Rubrivivax sp.]|nr:MAG: hypothetical protein EOP38_06295 [Rubrivivax sp.]
MAHEASANSAEANHRQRVAVYFVASPLQYLAAKQIALQHEQGARQVLIWYKPGMRQSVDPTEWDACAYMSWPRWEPMSGPFGRHRRLLANIDLLAALVGPCEDLHLHSAVFDTEAINYFLKALPARCSADRMRARILPDGLISIRRYPLQPLQQALQRVRLLRRLIAPDLSYWCFTGDRIGSDAPFCDRIYVLPGLPHQYPLSKTVELKPLAARDRDPGVPHRRRALVVGQPLVGAGLMSERARDTVSHQILQWLNEQGFDDIHYKGHPKDPSLELNQPQYQVLDLKEPLEAWMARQPYDAVVGVRSSSLLFARQIYGDESNVLAFGWDDVCFKSERERQDMIEVFKSVGVTMVS